MELQPWAPCLDRLATTPQEAAALLADAVAILQARAAHLAAVGHRVWEPSPDMPALVIIVDEYAELADEAPDAMSNADSIARLGRAVAVTIVAATQRPTQKAMGQGAVRSQMDTRICFRVRERRDVDLVLGQGMLTAGWHAHTLNAPGKFLISAPEHTTPRRARAYLVTDNDVARTVAHFAASRPHLDDVSRSAITGHPAEPVAWCDTGDAQDNAGEPASAPDSQDSTTPEGALWLALCTAPDEGADIAELIRLTKMSRATLYRHLAQHAQAGQAIQVSRGRWRATTTEDPR
jgi:S-DNA-T family DNA segregation ATPase FtsK/SpoIIIE